MNYYGKMDDSLWSQDASIKPRRDIETLLNIDGAKPIDLPIFKLKDTQANSEESLTKQFRVLDENDILLLQLPMYVADELELIKIAKATGARIIGLVHDIEYLRGFHPDWETQFASFKLCNSLIVAPAFAPEWLRTKGYHGDIEAMEIWPYLLAGKPKRPIYSKVINYAGNLDRAPQMGNMKLYGYANKESRDRFGNTYAGAYDPNDLPFEINTGYGLVWYNDQKFQEYTRWYATSHKISAYLAAGVPTIMQKGIQIGGLTGIEVDSLEEASTKVASIGENRYNVLLDEVSVFQSIVLSGNSFLEPYHNLLGGGKIG